jgi:hypothetical protein
LLKVTIVQQGFIIPKNKCVKKNSFLRKSSGLAPKPNDLFSTTNIYLILVYFYGYMGLWLPALSIVLISYAMAGWLDEPSKKLNGKGSPVTSGHPWGTGNLI